MWKREEGGNIFETSTAISQPMLFHEPFHGSSPYSEAFSLFCSLGIMCHSLSSVLLTSLIQDDWKSLPTIDRHTLEIIKPRKVRRDHQESRSCKGSFCVFHFRKAIEDLEF